MTIKHAVKAMHDNGKTITHCLHKYKNAQNVWNVVEEFGEVGCSMWADIARWHLTGWKFLVVGDSAGQLMPMFDRWSDSFQNRDVATSQFMHDLTRGLRCEL